jgi:hypothetical protein
LYYHSIKEGQFHTERKKIKLDSYAGEWVAFVGDKIVAHNKNLKDLMKEIDAKKLRKNPQFFWCQEKTKVYFFSVFHSEIAQELGIDLEKGKKIYLVGIIERILGYLHKVFW